MRMVLLISMLLIIFSACENGGVFQEPHISTISFVQAQDLIADGDIIIIDVRTLAEFNTGRIPGAILLQYDTISADTIYFLQGDRRPIFVYCRAGRRSLIAAEKLQELGFYTIYNLGDGLDSWCGPLE